VTGERVWLVPHLELPDSVGTGNLEHTAAAEAVQLYVDRASASFQEFVLTAGNLSSIVEICRRLDGIPLALELGRIDHSCRTRSAGDAQPAR
jgi:predicted ATPase